MEEQGRSLVIKIDREAVMKIAVNGDLFTLKKGMHELNLTIGGVPFREDSLVNQVVFLLYACVFSCLCSTKRCFHIFNYYICEAGEPSSGRLYEGVEVVDR